MYATFYIDHDFAFEGPKSPVIAITLLGLQTEKVTNHDKWRL